MLPGGVSDGRREGRREEGTGRGVEWPGVKGGEGQVVGLMIGSQASVYLRARIMFERRSILSEFSSVFCYSSTLCLPFVGG